MSVNSPKIETPFEPVSNLFVTQRTAVETSLRFIPIDEEAISIPYCVDFICSRRMGFGVAQRYVLLLSGC